MRPTLLGGDRKSQPLVAPRSGKQSYGLSNEVSLQSKHIALLKLSDFPSSCLTAELYVSLQPFDPHFFGSFKLIPTLSSLTPTVHRV